MSHLQQIESVVRKVANRRKWLRTWQGFWRGFLFAAILWAASLAAYKLVPLPINFLLFAALAGLLLPLLGVLLAALRPAPLLETARWVDHELRLKDRLTTALELASGPPTEWQILQLADAAEHAGQVPVRSLIRWQLPRSVRWAALTLLLCASLGFVPEFRSRTYLQKQRETDNIRQVGKQIADLTRRSIERRPPVAEPVEKALGSIMDLGEEMSKARLSRAEAVKELAKVTEKVEQTAQDLKQNPVLKSLEQARRAANSAQSPGDSKQRDALQKSAEKEARTAEAAESLKEEIQKTLEAASGNNQNSNDGKSGKENLSKSLSALAERAKALGLQMPGLQEALTALEQNNPDLVVQDLKTALLDLDKLQANAKALEQLAQQSNLGKDLAEQLNRTEIEAAQKTLEKMINELSSGRITQDQLQKMLKEVQKAVEPGGKYGKVGEHLAKAARNLQLGQKTPGANALKDAAAELDKLLKELNDMDSLLASLEALRRADLALSTGTGFGQCNSPGLGKGGRPGSGVGTWTDEGAYPPGFTELWDNTGVNRPDMDPRGHTDRGEGTLADNLSPTKVRGQISPGGSMPSITLKGVSIKGQSKVGFEEVLTAAQKEAQSAISQEQVPRAYQGAVRDYFDDLKK